MLRVYRSLLHLYPITYRREFGDEMSGVFVDARRDCSRGAIAKALFYVRELQGLLSGAVNAHGLNLLGVDNWLPFRRFNMHPEFKFPRSTVILMFVILAGVVLTIEKAKDITVKYGAPNVVAVGNPLPWFLLAMSAIALMVVAAGWGILFALHRTGMQRLSEVGGSVGDRLAQ
jgi:hypothetical protein